MQVLLLGGHGKVALHLTPLLLKRAWNVTSVVRNPAHESEILALGQGLKGKLNVLVSSLEDVKSASDAQNIIDTVSPDYVVWSAGTDSPPLYQNMHTGQLSNPKLETPKPRLPIKSRLTLFHRRRRQGWTLKYHRHRPRSRQALLDSFFRLNRRQ